MNDNKMAEVAKLFGKELGEMFSVQFITGRMGAKGYVASNFFFTVDGLFCEDRGPCECMLNDLLTGKAVIINA
jgi:hypothetical protein